MYYNFNYLEYDISYNDDIDSNNELAEFRSMKFYKTVVISTFLLASETRTLSRKEESKIQATEMKFIRRNQRYSILDFK